MPTQVLRGSETRGLLGFAGPQPKSRSSESPKNKAENDRAGHFITFLNSGSMCVHVHTHMFIYHIYKNSIFIE